MGKPVAGLNPEILTWARERAGRSVEDVAHTFKKDPGVIEAWENGDSAPTYVQLERLAYVIYKRPMAIFFFPEPPDEPDPEGSFRTLPDFELANLSADTLFKIRKARSFQLSLSELNEGKNQSQSQLFRDIAVEPHSDVIHVADQVREYLGIQLGDQKSWKYIKVAMGNWRAAIEGVGIYVFKDSFKQKDVSGFCLLGEEFPIIYVNNGTSGSRQIFTLFHELAHILVGANGITKQDDSFIDSLTYRSLLF